MTDNNVATLQERDKKLFGNEALINDENGAPGSSAGITDLSRNKRSPAPKPFGFRFLNTRSYGGYGGYGGGYGYGRGRLLRAGLVVGGAALAGGFIGSALGRGK